MPRGPRVIFKDDRDSNIDRGCVIYQGMLRPEIMCMVAAAAETAPDGMEAMHVSEGHRNIRDSRDLHEELRAWDISARGVPACVDEEELAWEMNAWANRIRGYLSIGSQGYHCSYTAVVHDTGSGLHIHIELDP